MIQKMKVEFHRYYYADDKHDQVNQDLIDQLLSKGYLIKKVNI